MTTMRSAMLLAWMAAAANLASCGGGAGAQAAAVRPKDLTFAEAVRDTGPCLEGDRFPRVLTVDWRSEERLDVEAAMKRGMAVVAYDCKGLRLLPDCRVEGTYGFIGVTRKEEAIRLENADEVRANLPLRGPGLAVSIGGELERGATLDIALVMVGKRSAARSEVTRNELVGACEGATHFVRAATVGAFVMSTGSRAKVATAAEIFGAGASASSGSDKQVQSRDGDLAQCRTSSPDREQPPEQCGALVRLDLATLGQPVPVFEHERAAAVCPRGFVLDGDKCARGEAARARPCEASNVDACFEQCGRGEPRSCTLLASLLATGQGVAKNVERARTLASTACEAGHADGCVWLGTIDAEAGRDREAVASYEAACSAGAGRGCTLLASLVREGRGSEADAAKADRLLHRGCAGGDEEACVVIESGSPLGVGDDARDRRALAQAKQACERGKPRACATLGVYQAYGIGTQSDPVRGYSQLSQECEQNKNVFACVQMASFMFSGIGTGEEGDGPWRRRHALQKLNALCDGVNGYTSSKAEREAVCAASKTLDLWEVVQYPETLRNREIACHGADYGRACYVVGRVYARGLAGAKADVSRARVAHQAACLRGVAASCALWADALVAERIPVAEAVLRSLYERGCKEARLGCGALGDRFRDGTGVPKDPAKALAHYQQGCSAGPYRQYDIEVADELACLRLGALYEAGRQVPRDPAKAAEAYYFGCHGTGGEACVKAAVLFDRLPEKTRERIGDAAKLRERACQYGVKSACGR